MPLGPPMPNGESNTMSKPRSFRVGTSGQFLVRFSVHTHSRRSWPASTSGFQPVESACRTVCLPSTAALVSAPPLKGTMVHLIPAWAAMRSMPICSDVPAPGVP